MEAKDGSRDASRTGDEGLDQGTSRDETRSSQVPD